MRVDAGQQHRTARGARRGGSEVGETHAGVGEPVEIGRRDLATEAAQVGQAEIIGDDQQDAAAWGEVPVSPHPIRGAHQW
jgi:hypothetical protein